MCWFDPWPYETPQSSLLHFWHHHEQKVPSSLGTFWYKKNERLIRVGPSLAVQSPIVQMYCNLFKVKVKFLSCVQLFVTTWTDCSPPGSAVHGILQGRILEWIAIFSSRGSSPSRDRTGVSCAVGGFFTTEPPGKLLWLENLIICVCFPWWLRQ